MNSILSAAPLRAVVLCSLAWISLAAKAAAEPTRWVTVTGTAELARNNTGYLLTSASNTIVSLPASPAVGTTVRVSGVGAGRWNAVANKGQSIQSSVFATFGILGSTGSISAIASSFDGIKVVASVDGGLLYASSDGGNTWGSNPSDQGNWVSVASTANGSLLLADSNPGGLFESTNSGAAWYATEAIVSCGAVACSADGTKIAQVYGGAYVPPPGPITPSSIHAGIVSISLIVAPAGTSPSANWTCLASSSSGANLIAAVGGGQIYISSDYGATWAAHGTIQNWTSVATSADGTKLTAVAAGSQIYTSNDSGNTWTAHGSIGNWTSVASSADGTELAASASDVIYTSVDIGKTWTSGGIAGSVVACSADGSKLIVGNGNQISIQPFPDASGKPATTFSAVIGTQLSSVELIFVGNGRWQLLSHEGPLSFQ